MAGVKTTTEPPSQSAAAIRIRDNQRRSRARRKEYVEGLERKVQEYEKRGVDATMQMQHAARTVALENSRLRMMLARMGAADADVDAFLQACQDREAAEALSSVSLRPLHHDGPDHETPSAGKRDADPAASRRAQQHGETQMVVDAVRILGGGGNPGAVGKGMPLSSLSSSSSSSLSPPPPPDPGMAFGGEPAGPAGRPSKTGCQPRLGTFTHHHHHHHPHHHHHHHQQQGMAGVLKYGGYAAGAVHPSAPAPSQQSLFDKLDVLASATLQQRDYCDGKTPCPAAIPTPALEAPSPSTLEPSTGAVTPSSPYAPELSPGASTVVQEFSSPMEMSCDAAAAIITEMQGHDDREAAKARLGCQARDECLVRNAVLFEVLDSATGNGLYS